MRPLDNPPARLIAWIALLGLDLFTSLPDMGNVASAFNGLQSGLSRVAFIAAKVLFRGLLPFGSFNHNMIQSRLQEFYIMLLGAAHD
jgi:hypothetical protein